MEESEFAYTSGLLMKNNDNIARILMKIYTDNFNIWVCYHIKSWTNEATLMRDVFLSVVKIFWNIVNKHETHLPTHAIDEFAWNSRVWFLNSISTHNRNFFNVKQSTFKLSCAIKLLPSAVLCVQSVSAFTHYRYPFLAWIECEKMIIKNH